MKHLLLIVAILLFKASDAQIHRSNSQTSLKYDSNFTIQKLINNDELLSTNNYLTWIFSIVSICLVALTGVFPVLVLPRLADNHEELGKLII